MRMCSYNVPLNELCQASKILPDGNEDFEVDNCPGNFDIFKHTGGKLNFAT